MKDPPDVSSRMAFSAWLCRQHNSANAALGASPLHACLPACHARTSVCVPRLPFRTGKPLHPCDAESLSRRWRTGGPGCPGVAPQSPPSGSPTRAAAPSSASQETAEESLGQAL